MARRKKAKPRVATVAPTSSSRGTGNASSRERVALRTDIERKKTSNLSDSGGDNENHEVISGGGFADPGSSNPSADYALQGTSSDQVATGRSRQTRSTSLPLVNYKVDSDSSESSQMSIDSDYVASGTSSSRINKAATGKKRVPVDCSGDEEFESVKRPKEKPTPKRMRNSITKGNGKPSTPVPGKRKGRAFPLKDDLPCGYVALGPSPEFKYVQKGPCQRNKKLPEHCEACISKSVKTGGCRFSGIRKFKYDYYGSAESDPTDAEFCVADDQMSLEQLSQAEDQQREMVFNSADAETILPLIGVNLLAKLSSELYHEEFHSGILKKTNLDGGPRPLVRLKKITLRTICDICSTTTLFGTYLSGCCGREICLDCWTEWTPVVKDGDPTMPDKCTNQRLHNKDSFYFATRAYPGEIKFFISSIRAYRDRVGLKPNDDNPVPDIPINTPIHPGEKGLVYLGTPTDFEEAVSKVQFQTLWKKGGIPLVIKGLKKKFTLPWDPEFFIEMYGGKPCAITDCGTGQVGVSTVGDFFRDFSKTDVEDTGTLRSLKLKDWPPESDFKDEFPNLFADFERALPFPEYTNRDASLNLVSRLPADWTKPDLGPKMYNAYPAPDFIPVKNGPPNPVKGTTNLHFDMTDAVNILVHQSGGPTPAANKRWKEVYGYPKCGAIWDIFPPESSAAIRRFLKKRDASVDDPLNRPLFYLTEEDLIELGKPEYNVRSYRIYQSTGDAVFVPAGCPHQVRNKQSCIKVAVDFFSAENAAVCTDLLADFRALAKATTKKGGMRLVGKRDDVLQPYNCLLFNWISLTGVSFERAVKTHKVDLANGKLIDEPSDSGSELTDLDEIEHEDFMLDYDLKSSEQSVSIQEDSGVGAESHRGNRKRAGLSNLDGDAAPMTNSKRVKKEHVPSTTGQKKANQRGSTAELDSNCDDDDVDAPQPRAKRVKRVSVRAPHKRRKVKGQVVTEVSTLEALSPSGSELGVRTVGPGLHLTKL
ncbi:unnamed protein product [Tuber melanosporum]|uniref:(Perigord truffle) hypothetical protein n=1 Tax=Tuber melanosporum (strain Mel28) TaxID=656061 RepID=D5G6Z8_TUBMM|nr:uncharacterized protein GSTUM_00002399001 [Tuber melanosporum]CAZ80291.1 unnamed protein product [Tuber melanosporum]